MTLQSAIEAELPFLRAEAEARMTSRVTVRRKTGAMTTDANGYEVAEWAAIYTDLPFELQNGTSNTGGSRSVAIGGVTFEDATAVGAFPAETLDLRDDDLVDITHGDWVASVYRIVEAVKKTTRKSRRVPIVEAPRPEEWA